ncbi:hypothetical protein [Vreelandella venusta]|uniref:hypothetical protein n=1 Tax=Vreelandella venusta TaxID=44935 RepID=UPI003F6797D8
MGKQYAERDIMALDKQGGHYWRHANAMTAEGLHSKSDIAAELAYRDARIAELERERDMHKAAEEAQIALRQKADERAQELAASLDRIVDAWMYDDTGIHDRYDHGVMLPVARYEGVNQAIMESRLKGVSLTRRDALNKADGMEWVLAQSCNEENEGVMWRNKIVEPEIQRLRQQAD